MSIVPAGGTDDGRLGTSIDKVRSALIAADSGAGVVVLPDLGSSVLTVRVLMSEGDDLPEPLAVADAPFVEGAVALGLSRRRVLWRHIIPNALTPVIVAAALGLGNAVTLEAGLSFLGLGVQPPAASWCNMIASGRDTLVNAPWVAAAPGIALVLVVVACTLLGDALQDALDPQRRRQSSVDHPAASSFSTLSGSSCPPSNGISR